MQAVPEVSSTIALPDVVEADSVFVGRTQELDIFTRQIINAEKPLSHVVTIWGEPGVGTSTLLQRFYEAACIGSGNVQTFAALVNDRVIRPVDMLERWALQLRRAGIPLPLFERLLSSYQDAVRRWDTELETARVTLTHDPAHGRWKGMRGAPVVGGLYEFVANKASIPVLGGENVSLPEAEAEVIRAFVEDVRWQTALPVSLHPRRVQRPHRVFLFCDAEGSVAAATIRQLLPHLLGADNGGDVVVVIAGQENPARWPGSDAGMLSLPLTRFTEEETRTYLAANDITDDNLITTLWQLSGGLPLALHMLSVLPGEAIDPGQSIESNLLHWFASQSQGLLASQIVLQGALFSRPFTQNDLAAFFSLLGEQIASYRWLTHLPFVERRFLDGRHRFHHLVQQRMCVAFFARNAQGYRVARRALVQQYRWTLKRIQAGEHPQVFVANEWLELSLALLAQLLELPDEASHIEAIAVVMQLIYEGKSEDLVVRYLHDLAREPHLLQHTNRAEATIAMLLSYCETNLIDPAWLERTNALFALVTQQAAFPARLLAQMYCRYGVASTANNDFARALEQFHQALIVDPECSKAWLLQGMTNTVLHQYQEAIAAFDQVLALESTNALAFLHRGIAWWKQRGYERALEDFDHALVLYPEWSEVGTLRSLVYGEMHLLGREFESLDYLVMSSPNDAQSFILRGLALCSLGDYGHALNDLDRALALSSENPQAHAARGHVYLEMGELERARADFLRSQEEGSQDETVSFLIEWIALCQKRPVFEDAARLEALATTSHDPALTLLCRGVAAVVREQYHQAITALEQAELFKPREGIAPFWKSLAFAFLGREEDASLALHQAMTAEPPVSAVLLAPLRWLEQDHPRFYKEYATSLLERTGSSFAVSQQENVEQG